MFAGATVVNGKDYFDFIKETNSSTAHSSSRQKSLTKRSSSTQLLLHTQRRKYHSYALLSTNTLNLVFNQRQSSHASIQQTSKTVWKHTIQSMMKETQNLLSNTMKSNPKDLTLSLAEDSVNINITTCAR